MLRRSKLSALCWAALVGWGSEAAGQDAEEKSWLSWQGPPECRNTAEVEHQLEALLGDPVEPSALPPTSVRLSWQQVRGWQVLVLVKQGGDTRRRQVHTESCNDAYDVVALTLALVLDPTLLGLSDDSGPTEDADPEVIELTPRDALEDTGDSGPLPKPDEGENAEKGAAPEPAPRPPPTLNANDTLRASALGRVDISSLSVPVWGGGAELSWRLARTELTLAGELLASGATVPRGAANPIEYSLGFGSVGARRLFTVERWLSWSLGASGQVGSLAVSELGGPQLRANGLWGAIAVGSGLGANIAERIRADLRLSLVFPLLRHELSLTNGDLVHTLPQVSLQMALALGFDMTE